MGALVWGQRVPHGLSPNFSCWLRGQGIAGKKGLLPCWSWSGWSWGNLSRLGGLQTPPPQAKSVGPCRPLPGCISMPLGHLDSCSCQVGAGVSPAWHRGQRLGWALRGGEPSQGQPRGRPEALPGLGRGVREEGNSWSTLAGCALIIFSLPP